MIQTPVATSTGPPQRGEEEFELQCTDCYRIFRTTANPQKARCDACGSNNVVPW